MNGIRHMCGLTASLVINSVYSSKFVKNINSLYITQLNEKCELGKKGLSALRDSTLY